MNALSRKELKMDQDDSLPTRVGCDDQSDELRSRGEKVMTCGIEVDPSRLGDLKYHAKKVYQILTRPDRPENSNSIQEFIALIRDLEKRLKTQFNDTKDFRQKLEKYLEGYDLRKADPPSRLRRARKKLRLTQMELARHIGYTSHVPIAQFEKGKRAPTRRVLEWLDSLGM
jgi:DNA-binding XRE family transcriptional regulator